MDELLQPIKCFLKCETPDSWIVAVKEEHRLAELLIDHCNCELKAAQTAMFLVRKYAVDKQSGEQLLTWAKPYEEFVYHNDRDMAAFLARDVKKNELIGELTPRAGFPHALSSSPR